MISVRENFLARRITKNEKGLAGNVEKNPTGNGK